MQTGNESLAAEQKQQKSALAQLEAGAADQLDSLNAQLEFSNAMLAQLDSEAKLQSAFGSLEDAVQCPTESFAAIIKNICRNSQPSFSMKRKLVIAAVAVVLLAGLGVVALVKSHCEESESGGDESTPTIVTVQTGVYLLATLHSYIAGFGTVETAFATAEQPAAGAQLAPPFRRCGDQSECHRRPTSDGRRRAFGIESGTMTVAIRRTASGTAEKIIRAAKYFIEKFAGRRDATGLVARYRAIVRHGCASQRQAGSGGGSTMVTAEVMDLNRLAVSAEIPAAEAADLKLGETVEIFD